MPPSTRITSLAALMLAFSSADALSLKRTYAGANFFDGFDFRQASTYISTSRGLPSTGLVLLAMSDFEGGVDPTKGFVDYLPRKQAEARGLAKVQGNQVRLAADSTTVYSTKDKGRASIRLEAKDTFDSGLLIADIAHMPGSACGSWPAFWTFNFEEDPYGEIDIIEGSMFQDGNEVTLWTGNQCRFTNIGSKKERNNCGTGGDEAKGCGSMGPSNSYGTPFNDVGGGALISDFQTKNGGCDIARNIHTQSVIINIDFCGSEVSRSWWEENEDCGRVASTCNEYVAKNPAAFVEAYWLIDSVKLFQ
ncbi:Endo-1-3(4)-beta-glucanase [Apiospora sp. TS-2023a]